ncbi:RDD family protein [Knoellia aerolata]|uniref:RDD domain-containing protein n=1 Tax=Knoellia aerolata DSM 18566 TaxID=1385519 RepID=A0A0A0JS70_9MICO|nr:RDD family protein [Knoellia aerolata]KGN38922.1 hypothetical protein N801_19890 [Knoellia aerolata DSM 18566]
MSTPSRPGWYENPDNPDELRYFDGILWTSNTTVLRKRPAPEQAAPAVSAPGAPPVPQQTSVPQQTPVPQQPPAPVPPGWGAQSAPQGWKRPSPMASVPGQPELAPYLTRVVAYLIDTLVIAVASLVVGGWFLWKAIEPIADRLDAALVAGDFRAMSSALGEAGLGWLAAFLAVQLLIMVGYHTFFLTRRGATPGKLLLGISVRRLDRPGLLDVDTAVRRVGFQAVAQALGNVPLVASLATIVVITDLVWPLADDRRQALHDKVAKTIVVKGRVER